MGTTRLVRGVIAAVGLALVPVATAEALGWVRLPNGSYAYQTDYTTSALFTCSKYIVVGSCSTTGNTVTLSNGGSNVTWSWRQGTNTLLSQFVGSSPFFRFGSLEKSISGSPNVVLPAMGDPTHPLFHVNIGVHLVGMSYSFTDHLNFSFIPNDPQSVRVGGYRSSFVFAGATHPVYGYHGVAGLYVRVPQGPISGDPGSLDILAQTSLATPEPVTLLLVGTGLAGIAAGARRRRARGKTARPGSAAHADAG
jgi:hypothetical protein